MYVAPRPREEDDPHFGVRLSIVPVVGLVIGIALQSPMAMIFPTLMYSLMAGQRKALNIGRALGGPIAFIVMLWVMSWVVSLTINLPVVMVLVMALIFFAGFYMIGKTGNPAGMLVIVSALMMSILGSGSYMAMTILRDEMSKAALASAIITPLLYLLIPPATREKAVDVYAPFHEDQLALRAAIRTGVLLLFALWLYAVVDTSNMMLAISAVFVLTFPTSETIFAEAKERSFATIMGGLAALGVLAVLTVVAQLPVLLVLAFLATLFFSQKMITGRHPAMVYQYAASVMISMVGGALATQEPSYAFLTRAALTVIGAIGAAFLTSLLEALLLKPGPAPALAAPEAAS